VAPPESWRSAWRPSEDCCLQGVLAVLVLMVLAVILFGSGVVDQGCPAHGL